MSEPRLIHSKKANSFISEIRREWTRWCIRHHITYFNSTLGGVEPSVLLEPPLAIDTLSCSCSYAASVSNRVSRSKSWSWGDGGGEAEWLLTSEIAASRILHSSNWLCRKKKVNTIYSKYWIKKKKVLFRSLIWLILIGRIYLGRRIIRLRWPMCLRRIMRLGKHGK